MKILLHTLTELLLASRNQPRNSESNLILMGHFTRWGGELKSSFLVALWLNRSWIQTQMGPGFFHYLSCLPAVGSHSTWEKEGIPGRRDSTSYICAMVTVQKAQRACRKDSQVRMKHLTLGFMSCVPINLSSLKSKGPSPQSVFSPPPGMHSIQLAERPWNILGLIMFLIGLHGSTQLCESRFVPLTRLGTSEVDGWGWCCDKVG